MRTEFSPNTATKQTKASGIIALASASLRIDQARRNPKRRGAMRCARCQQCGTEFQTYFPTQRFCNPRCRHASLRNAADDFWSRVEKTDHCWLWTGGTDEDGYGMFVLDQERRAHRVAFELSFGPIPEGMCVCHHCDNPRCVRPDHLFLGTNEHNQTDKLRKGRQSKGEMQAAAKLTNAAVLEIRSAHENGESNKSLARRFSVSDSAIWSVIHGRSWKHIS